MQIINFNTRKVLNEEPKIVEETGVTTIHIPWAYSGHIGESFLIHPDDPTEYPAKFLPVYAFNAENLDLFCRTTTYTNTDSQIPPIGLKCSCIKDDIGRDAVTLYNNERLNSNGVSFSITIDGVDISFKNNSTSEESRLVSLLKDESVCAVWDIWGTDSNQAVYPIFISIVDANSKDADIDYIDNHSSLLVQMKMPWIYSYPGWLSAMEQKSQLSFNECFGFICERYAEAIKMNHLNETNLLACEYMISDDAIDVRKVFERTIIPENNDMLLKDTRLTNSILIGSIDRDGVTFLLCKNSFYHKYLMSIMKKGIIPTVDFWWEPGALGKSYPQGICVYLGPK